MKNNRHFQEKRLLKLSIYGSIGFAVVAIVWGVIIRSNMVIFDGLYSLVSIVLTLFSLLAASYIKKSDFSKFPFGKETLEPLVIIFKYFVIIALCLYAASSAFSDLLSGGRYVNPGYVVVYTIIGSSVAMLIYSHLRRRAQAINSEFVTAEANQWLMDIMLSIAVIFGFGIAYALDQTPWAYLVYYVDPLMVLIASLYFLKIPIESIISNFKEVLEMAPDDDVQEIVQDYIDRVEDKYRFEDSVVRLTKVGSRLFIEIDFILGDDSKVINVDDFDAVREEIYDHINNIKEISYSKWLRILFTRDRRWVFW